MDRVAAGIVQCADVLRRCASAVQDPVGVHLGNLGATDSHPLHPRRLDERAGTEFAWRVAEDTARAWDAEWLMFATPTTNLLKV